MERVSSGRGLRLTPQLVLGLLIIGAGVLLTLDNLGYVDAFAWLEHWALGLIALGLSKVWHAREGHGGAVGGLVLIGAGTWLSLERLGYLRVNVEDAWPLLLVALGVSIVLRGIRGRSGAVAASPGRDSNATVTAFAMMAGLERGNNSKAFRGGELTAIMGGCELDLRQAAIDGEAVIDVFAMWGGIEITVPDDWTVVGQVTPLLGAFEDTTRPPQGAMRHRLVVRGFVIMGGVEVKN